MGGTDRGQGMIEFALVLPVLLLIIAGILDFGLIMSDREAIINAARDGARYATVHPTAWSNAASPPLNTIEGVIRYEGGPVTIPNDDSHIMITYLKPDGTYCGNYSVTSGFQGTQNSCVVPGNLIQVKITYVYSAMTPGMQQLFPNGIPITGTAVMTEEL